MSRLNIYENNMKNGSGEEAEETSRFVHIRRSADRLKQLGEYKRYPKNAVLIDMGEMAGCSRPLAQVEAEALDMLLQAVSSDNQGPEVEY